MHLKQAVCREPSLFFISNCHYIAPVDLNLICKKTREIKRVKGKGKKKNPSPPVAVTEAAERMQRATKEIARALAIPRADPTRSARASSHCPPGRKEITKKTGISRGRIRARVETLLNSARKSAPFSSLPLMSVKHLLRLRGWEFRCDGELGVKTTVLVSVRCEPGGK